MHQTTLSKFKINQPGDNEGIDAHNYTLKEEDKLMQDSMWTRVKTREEMDSNDIEVYSFKKDYIAFRRVSNK